jgi:hypothetical protein
MLPELELWIFVMFRAIDDLQGNNDCESSRYRSLRSLEARNWFRSDVQTVGSFLWICGQLSLDPEAVRQQVLDNFDPRKAGAPKDAPHSCSDSLVSIPAPLRADPPTRSDVLTAGEGGRPGLEEALPAGRVGAAEVVAAPAARAEPGGKPVALTPDQRQLAKFIAKDIKLTAQLKQAQKNLRAAYRTGAKEAVERAKAEFRDVLIAAKVKAEQVGFREGFDLNITFTVLAALSEPGADPEAVTVPRKFRRSRSQSKQVHSRGHNR